MSFDSIIKTFFDTFDASLILNRSFKNCFTSTGAAICGGEGRVTRLETEKERVMI